MMQYSEKIAKLSLDKAPKRKKRQPVSKPKKHKPSRVTRQSAHSVEPQDPVDRELNMALDEAKTGCYNVDDQSLN